MRGQAQRLDPQRRRNNEKGRGGLAAGYERSDMPAHEGHSHGKANSLYVSGLKQPFLSLQGFKTLSDQTSSTRHVSGQINKEQ